MTDQAAELDDALEQVMAAARVHLAAVKDAGGAIDDERVWHSYVALNNASFEYDQLLLDRYGEVTPWETESIDLRATEAGAEPSFLTAADIAVGQARDDDPYPAVVSVRQRRDYRVPSMSGLLAAAEDAAHRGALDDEELEPPETLADAVLELVRDGDGSLAGLDVPELEPLAGVVTVSEVPDPLDVSTDDSSRLFQAAGEKLVGRVDEEPYREEERLEEEQGTD